MPLDVNKLYRVFTNPNHKTDSGNIEWAVNRFREVVTRSFSESGKAKPPRVRASNIGKPDRQLWFEFNQNKIGLGDAMLQIEHGNEVDDVPANFIDGPTYMKFLYGDIIEIILVLLCKEAGYDVDVDQTELNIDKVTGHPDMIVTHPDGKREVVDTKSASRFSFDAKFEGESVVNGDDPFGYIGQNSFYRQATNADQSGWLTANKDTGKLNYLPLPKDKEIGVEERVGYLKTMLKGAEPPEQLCYPLEEEAKTGNKKINKECSFCPFKFQCHGPMKVYKQGKKWAYYPVDEIKETPKGEEIDFSR